MSIDFINDVFAPVLERTRLRSDELAPHNQLNKAPGQAGVEDPWFQKEVAAPAIRDRGYDVRVRGKGPDLVFNEPDLELEMKAGNELRPRYFAGIEADGWFKKYVEHQKRPRFAGCLFLACEHPEREGEVEQKLGAIEQTSELRSHGIRLAACRTFYDSDFCPWIMGILLTPVGYGQAEQTHAVMDPISSETEKQHTAPGETKQSRRWVIWHPEYGYYCYVPLARQKAGETEWVTDPANAKKFRRRDSEHGADWWAYWLANARQGPRYPGCKVVPLA
jgi:hypothetical protein